MATASEARIHERLDEIVEDQNQIKIGIAEMCANTRECHKVVMGNGMPAIGIRVDRLEQTNKEYDRDDARKGKRHYAIVAFISAVASGGVLLIAAAVMHAMGH